MVAHDLHLVFLPAEETLFDKDLMDGGKIEAVGGDAFEFFAIVGDTAALTAEREGRADDEREVANGLGGGAGLFHGFDGLGAGDIEADLDHRLFKELAVFALVDRVGLGTDHLDAVLGEDARLKELHRKIERGLPTESREERGGLLGLDDFFEAVDRERFDVGHIGKLRIGHDRGRVGVDQNHAVTLFLQGLASLGAGVIELASLADNDGAGANDEDGLEIGAFGHGRECLRGWEPPAAGQAERRPVYSTGPPHAFAARRARGKRQKRSGATLHQRPVRPLTSAASPCPHPTPSRRTFCRRGTR